MDKKFLMTEKSLAGHLLVATPAIQESVFARSVIYLCGHNAEGAMGIIINYPVNDVKMKEIWEQLEIEAPFGAPDLPVHFGGPVESYRGFVVHSAQAETQENIFTKDGIAVSASVGILQKIAQGNGPAQGMLMLGYAGWAPGQLESEIESGSWIVAPATQQLVFGDSETKWDLAIASLGFDMGNFSSQVGHA